MPKFIIKRWHGYHMVFAMSFCLTLVAILSIYHWFLGLMGLLIFLGLAFMLYRAELSFRSEFASYIETLGKQITNAGQIARDELPIGMILHDSDGKIEWHNAYVSKIKAGSRLIGVDMNECFPELKEVHFDSDSPIKIVIQDRVYEVLHQKYERLYFFRDITRLHQVTEKYHSERVVIGYLHMDNYDDAGQGLSDQESTQLLSDVAHIISKWSEEYQITIKRIETDKMFLVCNYRSLEKMIASRFDILDQVREMTRGYTIPITLSLGLASNGENMIERSQYAQAALDIALARGGDQAAVQMEEKIDFFGGKTNAIEKRTRVRARVISHAMSNLIRDCRQVIVMGHKRPDMDALGAAIGVVKFSLINQCEGFIVLDDENTSIQRLMDLVKQHDYLGDHIITPERALQMIDDKDTLLILVDTHKPSLAIEPKLLERAHKVIVIDHHRRGQEFVKDPVLVYLEPYASSTSELVTELFQYRDQRLVMDTLEATSLLAGIVVDTKNFAFRSGSRTFEAASFLRRHGADLMMVQSLLKEDLNQYVKRAEIIKNTQLLYNEYAIALGDEQEVYDQLIIAQAADALLGMQGVSASFVIGRRNDGLISISARSQGELNVQFLMEKLGGGGHLTNAACQLKLSSLAEAKTQLVQVIKEIESIGGIET
ncbi:DHH family phosphoesterase [Hazenella sp. IB182357]|uniref:Cyclic-di-AMP phosphodiesterase n=1 Tax=Polycladospora coralii TaxID=2771432 RepID=A0A926N6F3_9BACL|nr:DHH family phosphoesterase [Polycladospora coralii]MBD1371996.1 DHH family phosphoesterase [Polycladospora coralii]